MCALLTQITGVTGVTAPAVGRWLAGRSVLVQLTPGGDLENVMEALEAARDHLLRAAHDLSGFEWSKPEPRRRAPSVCKAIEEMAFEVSLLVDLLEFERQ